MCKRILTRVNPLQSSRPGLPEPLEDSSLTEAREVCEAPSGLPSSPFFNSGFRRCGGGWGRAHAGSSAGDDGVPNSAKRLSRSKDAFGSRSGSRSGPRTDDEVFKEASRSKLSPSSDLGSRGSLVEQHAREQKLASCGGIRKSVQKMRGPVTRPCTGSGVPPAGHGPTEAAAGCGWTGLFLRFTSRLKAVR